MRQIRPIYLTPAEELAPDPENVLACGENRKRAYGGGGEKKLAEKGDDLPGKHRWHHNTLR